MIGPTLLWLLTLELFAVVAFPIAHRAFPNMPDRGWALSKPLGVLAVGFVVWLLGLTHTLPNSRWSVLLALLIVGGLSWMLMRNNRDEVLGFVRRNANLVVTTELLFIAAFLGMVLFRASVPSIAATEQPMDFMFLNAAVTSPHYPPNDPWLAGHTVSYYYLGYVLLGSVTMFTGIATPIAYNLGLATAAALGAVAAFGVTFNLVRLARGSEDGGVFAGIAAAFLLLVASNLAGTLELVRSAGIGDADFWAAVGINGFTAPDGPASSWRPVQEHLWWWKASRVVPPGHINEFPLFSFLVGDMHPHVMSMGFVLLTAGVAIQIYLQRGLLRFSPGFGQRVLNLMLVGAIAGLVSARFDWNFWWVIPLLAVAASTLFTQAKTLVLVAVVTTGALGALNLWDLPLGLALVGGAVLLGTARNERSYNFGASVAIAGDIAIIGAPSDSTAVHKAGSAMAYVRSNGVWRKAGDIQPLNAFSEGRFGTSVSVDKDLAVIGAPGSESVSVYQITEGQEPSLRTILRAPVAAAAFGRSVAIDSTTVAVGAIGMVFLFQQNDSRWEVLLRINAPEHSAGYAAAIDLRDGVLAVGDPDESTVYIYRREAGGWTEGERVVDEAPAFGWSVSVARSAIAVGADGTATLFERHATNGWQKARAFEAPPGVAGFGRSISLDGRYLAVGADGGVDSSKKGCVTVFKDNAGGWEVQSVLSAKAGAADAYFGNAIGVEGNSLIVGSPGRGQGGAYFYGRELDQWGLSRETVSRWRLAPAVMGMLLIIGGAIAVAFPFLVNFDSNAQGVKPLLSLITRPVHLMFLWGIQGMLAIPLLALALPAAFSGAFWSWKRILLVLFAAFAPILIWLQPGWSWLAFAVGLGLFGLHQAGYRMPRADETTFAYNPRVTLTLGGLVIVGGLLWDGLRSAERGAGGELLAIDRLLVTVPMAIVVALAAYAMWTLAHRDSEAIRENSTGGASTSHDGIVPALGLLATAGMLIMGIELFHVVDAFGGDYRRLNTMFKLGYQAWLLFAVVGGFAVWYVASHLNRTVLWGRIASVVWGVLLVAALGAVSYYPLAALSERVGGGQELTLDGQAHVQRQAPAEHAAIQWIRDNTASDAIIVEAAVVPCASNPNGCHSYTDAGRISSSTARPTIIGWRQHEGTWRNSALHPELDQRMADVRTIYETPSAATAAGLLEEYGVDYVVVGPREQSAYGATSGAKWEAIGSVAFREFSDDSEVTIYRLEGAES